MNDARELNEREWRRQVLETLQRIEHLLAPKECVYEARGLPAPYVQPTPGTIGAAWCRVHGWDCPNMSKANG